MNVQPFLTLFVPEGQIWVKRKDGDPSGRDIMDRHYSRRRYADGRKPMLYVGPGEKLVMLTPCARALFIWRKFIDDSGQEGVNCAAFRNEGQPDLVSSTLIRAADAIAFERWPGERHYTYVDARKVKSANPGFCFIAAGWRRYGITKKAKMIILEKHP